MFNDKIKRTIESISAISSNAKVIADRLGVTAGTSQTALAKSSTSDVEALKREIDRLTKQVERLQGQLDDEPDDAVFTDDDAYEFQQQLEQTVGEMSQAIVCAVYNETYLKPYPRNVRYLICLSLVNSFQTRNLEPLPLWYGVVANHGSIS